MRQRVRSVASVLMLIVGTLATLATTPPPDSLLVEAQLGPFLLDPSHPLVTVPLTFSATPQARAGTLSITLWVDDLWIGQERRGLDVDLVRADGDRATSPWAYSPVEQAFECRGLGCVAPWHVSFGPRSTLLDGASVRVAAQVFASATFGGEDVPNGAEIAAVFEDVSGSAGRAGSVASGRLGPTETMPVVVERFEVSTNAGLDARELWFGWTVQRYEPITGSEPTVIVQQSGIGDTTILPRTGTELVVPPQCRDGPCQFAFRVVTSVRPPGDFVHWKDFGWAIESSPPADFLDVTHVGERVPSLSASVSLPHLAVQGSGQAPFAAATVRISSEALAGDPEPVVFARVVLEDYRSDWPSSSADSALVRLVQEAGDVPMSWTGYGQPDPADGIAPAGAVLTVPCDPGADCSFDLWVVFGVGSEVNGPDTIFEATPVLTVSLLYPLGNEPRNGSVKVFARLGSRDEPTGREPGPGIETGGVSA